MLLLAPVFQFAFLPAVPMPHSALPRNLRNGMVLLASLLFCAWGEPLLVLVMLLSLTGNIGLGLLFERHRDGPAVSRIMAVASAFTPGLESGPEFVPETARRRFNPSLPKPLPPEIEQFLAVMYIEDLHELHGMFGAPIEPRLRRSERVLARTQVGTG